MINKQPVNKEVSNVFKKGLSLRTQFYALIISMVFFAFAASLINSTLSLRSYLQQQLASHAQDAAHNLGLAISSSGPNDAVLLRTLAQSLFDTGYYASLHYETNEGQTLIDLKQPTDTQVPQWFAHHAALSAPAMTSEIGDGWISLGKLTVVSHTGLALQTLWQQTQHNAAWSLVLFMLAALAVHAMIGAILLPLKRISAQAKAVMQKDFSLLNVRTVTREMRDVMGALNNMVSNVNQVFTEQSQQASQLLQQAYLDPLTSLPNRRALMQQLPGLRDDALLANNAIYVAMINLDSLAAVNEQLGYASGDDYVQAAVSAVKPLQAQGLTLYRLSGATFLLIGPLSPLQAQDADRFLQRQLTAHDSTRYEMGFASTVSLLTPPQDSIKHILAKLDALHTQDTVFLLNSGHLNNSHTGVIAASLAEWESIIQRLLHTRPGSDEPMQLLLLPVMDEQHNLLYAEALLRFVLDEQQLSTLEVMAMAQRLNLADTLEQTMLAFTLAGLSQLSGGMVALNVSLAVLQNPSLRQWLLDQLDAQQGQLPPLAVEIAEGTLTQLPEQCATFIEQLKQRQITVIIERFGENLTSLHHIKGLDIDYVKLDARLATALDHENNRFILNTLTQICHSVGIKVLATHLESEGQLSHCKQLNINGFQGFLLRKATNFTLLRKKHNAKPDKISYTLNTILNPDGDTKNAT